MSDTFHFRTVTKSRQARVCDWCDEQITVGSPYVSYRCVDDNDAHGTVKLHPECHSACNDLAMTQGDGFSWSGGDFCRGCSCERGDCQCGKKKEPAR
jgi:hypothetical protein